MADLSFSEILQMQTTLQEKYLQKWGGVSPDKGIQKLLWMHGELGEASDVLKKHGTNSVMQDEALREHFVEELCDALMYFGDILLCYNITPEEVSEAYRKKFEKNMHRW